MFKVIHTKYTNKGNQEFEFPSYDAAYKKACEIGKDTTQGLPVIQLENGQLQYVPVDFIDGDMVSYSQVKPAIFDIVLFPEKTLLSPSIPFTEAEIDEENFKQLVFSMFMTMYVYNGIGLAAPQIGLNRQLFVMDTQLQLSGVAKPKVFINPKITEFEGVQEGIEGCLSSPGLQCKISRPEEITIEYLGLNKQPQSILGYGLDAACFTHEIEHLMGRTIASKTTNYERSKYLKKYHEAKRKIKKVNKFK